MTLCSRAGLLALMCAAPPCLAAWKTAPIDAVLRAAVERGDIPGVVAMVATPDAVVYRGAFGKRDAAAGIAMTEDTIFAIYSMTKPVTSVATMQLVEQGNLTLDAPIQKFLPALGNVQVLDGFRDGEPQLRPAARAITVRHLLTHTSGFAYSTWDKNLRAYQEQRKAAASDDTPLVFEPGARWEYGTSVDTLGKLVESVSGVSLEEYFRRHIFQSLGMADTAYNAPAASHSRIVSTHRRQADGSLREQPRTAPEPVTSFSGGGGLYSTAGDYVKFMQMILRRGSGGAARVLQPKTVAMMTRNQTGNLAAGRLTTVRPELSNDVDFHPGFDDRFGFGFLINPVAYQRGRSRGSLAWAGLGNTYFWIDPERKLCAVILMQILPFFDKQAVALLRQFEQEVYANAPGH